MEGDERRFAHVWRPGHPHRWYCVTLGCGAEANGLVDAPEPGYCVPAARAYVAAQLEQVEVPDEQVRRLTVLRAPLTPDPDDVFAVCGLCGQAVEPLQDIIAFRLLVLHEGCAEIIAKIMRGGRS